MQKFARESLHLHCMPSSTCAAKNRTSWFFNQTTRQRGAAGRSFRTQSNTSHTGKEQHRAQTSSTKFRLLACRKFHTVKAILNPFPSMRYIVRKMGENRCSRERTNFNGLFLFFFLNERFPMHLDARPPTPSC